MMRTMKQKMKAWKIAAITSMIPLIFFIVACQDQVMNDLTSIAKNTTNALIVPDDIQARFEALKKSHPGSKYILVEFNSDADPILAAMEKQHGIPKSIELYTPDGPNAGPVVGKASEVIIESANTDVRTYAIIEYNGLAKNLSDLSRQEDGVYSVVEETASPKGGLGAFYNFLALEILYPKQAREKGMEGKVFVEFIVQTDGSLSEFKILKGSGADLDQEALRVLRLMPAWNPGKVDGKPVKQRMIVPIAFKLDNDSNVHPPQPRVPQGAMPETVVTAAAPSKQ